MGQINLGGTTAAVQLMGNDSIATAQPITFPDRGGTSSEVVVSDTDQDLTTTGDITAANVFTTQQLRMNVSGGTTNYALGGLPGAVNFAIKSNGGLALGGVDAGSGTPDSTFRYSTDTSVLGLYGNLVTAGSWGAIEVRRSLDFTEGQSCFVRVGENRGGGSERYTSLGVRCEAGATYAAPYVNIRRGSDGSHRYYWTGVDNNLRTSTSAVQVGSNNGTVVGTQTSDERLKQNIRECPYGLDTVMQLEPILYEFKSTPDRTETGFIAQQVAPLIPEAVSDTGDPLEPINWPEDSNEPAPVPASGETILAMDYARLIPALVNSIKELKAEIETLKGAKA